MIKFQIHSNQLKVTDVIYYMDSYMISISLSHCPSFVINIKRYVTSDKHTRAHKYYNYGVSFNSVFSCRVGT